MSITEEELAEDRGDGRSSIHLVPVPVTTLAYVEVQRDGDAYVASAKRIGLAKLNKPYIACADTPEGAVERCLEIVKARLAVQAVSGG